MKSESYDQCTIIAQCTPQGKGALALLRISGTDAFKVAEQLSALVSGKKLSALPTHTIHYGWVVDENGNRVDQVLFLLMHAPHTFTGQNTVEITCHNNQFIIENIIAQAIKNGARLAQEGEFSKRAFLNNKIDLIQAEAINELIHANTQHALKKSLAQLEGSLSHALAAIEQELLKAIAFSEASFEFIDEEIEFKPQISQSINNLLFVIKKLKKSFDQQQHIREGIRVAIIGAVNAGKSSLFNALLDKQRAIVTHIPGTTRDTLEAGIYREGSYRTLVDTAGLRETNDIIEQEGIARSLQEAHKADVILLAFEGTRNLSAQEYIVYHNLLEQFAAKIILVQTKADGIIEKNPFNQKAIAVSGTTKKNIEKLEQIISEKISALLQKNESPFLLNQRQYTILLQLEKHLITIDNLVSSNTVAYELLSCELKTALEQLTELTGKSISEASMNTLFKEFCVGK